MPGELVLDSGSLVALVDWGPPRHEDCVAALDARRGPLVTTEAVLTEALYLLGPSWRAQEICLQYFLRGAFHIAPCSRDGLQRIVALLDKYADLPMDFADATLVALAEELGTDQVFTLDKRDFTVYRLYGKMPFCIVP